MTSKLYTFWTDPETGHESTVEVSYALVGYPSPGARDSLGVPEEPDDDWDVEITRVYNVDTQRDVTQEAEDVFPRFVEEVVELLTQKA